MDLENTTSLMEISMKGCGRTTRETVKEFTITAMEKFTEVTITKANEMALVYLTTKMEIVMKVNGRMAT